MTKTALEKLRVSAGTSEIHLMGHVIANFPSAAQVRQMIGVMAAAGVKIIEIQIPFSEPVADGPLFMAANHQALNQGVNLEQSLALLKESQEKYPQVYFLAMTYLNIVYQRKYESFAADLMHAKSSGVIVADLPFDQAAHFESILAANSLANIRIAAPNIDERRLEQLLNGASGFVYAVARRGVTGAKTAFGQELFAWTDRLRAKTALPVAVGFGIATPEDVSSLIHHADIAIVGTASMKAYNQGGLDGFRAFWTGLAKAAGAPR